VLLLRRIKPQIENRCAYGDMLWPKSSACVDDLRNRAYSTLNTRFKCYCEQRYLLSELSSITGMIRRSHPRTRRTGNTRSAGLATRRRLVLCPHSTRYLFFFTICHNSGINDVMRSHTQGALLSESNL
jgi:hypothetical protein